MCHATEHLACHLSLQVELNSSIAEAGVAAGSRYLILKASVLPTQPTFLGQAAAVMPGPDSVPSIIKFEVPLARPPKCTAASCLQLAIESDVFPTASMTASAVGFSSSLTTPDIYQGLEYEFGIAIGPAAAHAFKPLMPFGPSSQYTFKSLPQGDSVLYVCVAVAGTPRTGAAAGSALRVCEKQAVTIKAPATALDLASVAASVNVSMLERSGDLASLADAARLLSGLAAYAKSGNSSAAGNASGSLQSAVQQPAIDLVMSASRMVNRDSPEQMHQVREVDTPYL